MITEKRNGTVDERWDRCEHLNDGDTADVYYVETDTFGIVGIMGYCTSCNDEMLEERADEEDECTQCHDWFPNKELRTYTPYGMCPSAGEEPLELCSGCLESDTHRRRQEECDRNRQLDEEEDEARGYYD